MNLYFDNASTSFPKPLEVGNYIEKYLEHGGTYGRAAYPRILDTSRVVEDTRELLAKLIGTSLISNVLFTYNSTHALNTTIQGFKYRHKRIFISPLEHNAVARTVEFMRQSNGIEYFILPHFSDGLIDLKKLDEIDFSRVDLVIVNHVSNVNGLVQPINDIKKAIGDVPLLVDACQSIGKSPVFVDDWDIDMLAFSGHKGLHGPTGIGGLFLRNPDMVSPFVYGGTGSNSEKLVMPSLCPDRFEAGTQNIIGIYGLYGALVNPPEKKYSITNFHGVLEKLQRVKGIKLLVANDIENQSDLFSFVPINSTVSNFSRSLYNNHKIEVRGGLHCSPLAHKTFGTFPHGSIRVSLSNYHTDNEIFYLYESIVDINQRTLNG